MEHKDCRHYLGHPLIRIAARQPASSSRADGPGIVATAFLKLSLASVTWPQVTRRKGRVCLFLQSAQREFKVRGECCQTGITPPQCLVFLRAEQRAEGQEVCTHSDRCNTLSFCHAAASKAPGPEEQQAFQGSETPLALPGLDVIGDCYFHSVSNVPSKCRFLVGTHCVVTKSRCFSHSCVTVRCIYVSSLIFLFNSKIEDAFYKGELRLNGEKLWKKSRTVSHCACDNSHTIDPAVTL